MCFFFRLGVRRNEGLGQNMFDNGDVHVSIICIFKEDTAAYHLFDM